MENEIKSVKRLDEILENGPYAWPGGYPLFFITSDGEALSFKTVKKEYEQIVEAIKNKDDSGWRVVGFDINWEDDSLFDAHTGEKIECAYCD